MKSLVLIAFMILTTLGHSESTCRSPTSEMPSYPGIKFSQTADGLAQLFLNDLTDLFQYLVYLLIPDIEASVDLLGYDIDIAITDIIFSDVEIQSMSASCDVSSKSSPPSVAASLENLVFQGTFNWEYTTNTYPYISDNGYATYSIVNCNALATIVPFMDLECHTPQINITAMDLDLGDIDVELYGGASWLYDLLIDLLIPLFEDALADQLGEYFRISVQDAANDYWGNWVAVFYSPTGCMTATDGRLPDTGIEITATEIILSIVGWQLDRNRVDDTKHSVSPLPMPPLTEDAAMQTAFDRAVFSSSLEIAYEAGFYEAVIEQEDVPEDYQVLLTTDILAEAVPSLAGTPTRPLRLEYSATARPVHSVQPVALYTEYAGDLSVVCDGEVLFTLNTVVGYTGVPSWYLWTELKPPQLCIYMEHAYYNQTAAVEAGSSSVGDVDVVALGPLLGLLWDYASEELTLVMKQKTPVCIPDVTVQLVEPFIAYRDTYWVIYGDVLPLNKRRQTPRGPAMTIQSETTLE
eukprot:gnl/Dysnectes_brevis/2828_a3453_1002.p1 GENE.gnl/Dysnectes_brevis/2828_a3453_1002~~gnl/Dysnectes_brevis/2828_a3453_1002.p1  ORF type:complete len:522 (+),score=108.14 gnl/Dysnectes_brevis/2828_a3453_1002:115-1680(+)